jgi:LysM repeat protein
VIEHPRGESAPDTWHVCPVLGLAGDREHRLATWHPDHRCWARPQPATIEREFQTTVCTTDGYIGCPAYHAWAWGSSGGDGAAGVDVTAGEGAAGVDATDLADAGPAPAPLEPTGAALPGGRGRRAGRVTAYAVRGLVILGVVVAALAVVVGIGYVTGAVPIRLGAAVATSAPTAAPSPPAPTPQAASPTAAPTLAATPGITPAPNPSLTPAPTPEAFLTPAPSPSTAALPTPRVYVVRFGDTLISIAAKFGVTVRAIEKLNAIKDPGIIQVGQRIEIPLP